MRCAQVHAVILLLLVFFNCEALAVEEEIDMKLGCKNNPQLVDACFSVHGRLSAYNGNPSLRIWPIGTHRLLGVLKDEESLSIPENIRNLAGFDKDIYGDFLVCPLTRPEPGSMQFVCIEAASNVHAKSSLSSRGPR